MMAGDDVRPPTQADGPEPNGPGSPPVDQAAAAERAFPSARASEAAAAALAASDRPAETVGAPDRETPPEKRSLVPTVLAVIGVIIVVLLGANLYALYNPPANDTLSTAVADVASLKQRVAAIEARPQQTVDLSPIDQRLKDLSADVATLKGSLGATTAKADAATALAPKLTAVQAAVAALPKVDLGPLDARIAGVDGKLGTAVGAVDAKITGLDGKLAALDTRLAGAAAATDKRLVPLEAYFNAPKSSAQVTEQRQNGSAAETRAAPLAVIAQGIVGALSEGRPFATEAAALGKLGVDNATLAPLTAVADKGAPTRADLVAGFAAVQDRMVVAAAPVETGTVLDRMMANAASVVSVKRTGAAKGADAGAIASRIDADLKRGAFAAALSEWETLPEDSKSASADWAAGLKARVAAEAAARSIQAKAVTALAAAP